MSNATPFDVAVASPRDAAAILRLRDSLASWLIDHDIKQWRPGELPVAWIEALIDQRSAFVVRTSGSLVAG